uniref:Predicted protein n=1 Tax=Hordeum vulgare subsp. vulgare TaxID=112509 RepID=F2CUW4_HORVV|nr:predicted protein [Hordeum vulgare subsp. vulgare]
MQQFMASPAVAGWLARAAPRGRGRCRPSLPRLVGGRHIHCRSWLVVPWEPP